MPDPEIRKMKRLEVATAVLIAIVSFATALVIYMTNNASSIANTNNHQGMITAVKVEAFANENWRMTYQEASSAYSYAVVYGSTQVLKSSQLPAALSQVENYERYLLPNLRLLAQPFSTDNTFTSSDGTIDLQTRFITLQDTPEIKALDPVAYFNLAEESYSEQRWYLVGSILMAFSLFWLTISQINHNRRLLTLFAGCFFFLSGILWVAAFLISKGGA